MLTLQVLNSDALLNTFTTQSSYTFTEGSDCIVVLRLFDVRKNIRYIPNTGVVFEIKLMNSDGTTLTKVPTTLFADDRSILEFSITAAESLNLPSQNILLKMTEGVSVTQVLLRNGLSKTVTTGC